MTITANSLASFSTYLSEVQRTPLLSALDERELAARILAGDMAARDWMVRANLRLVVNIARSFAGRGVPIEDLMSEGNMGLMRAVEGFDPNMNTRFATYASFWINQSIRRGIVNAVKTIHIPAYLTRLLGKWGRATGVLADELGRPPTHDEVAGRVGLSKKMSKVVVETIRIASVSQSENAEYGPGLADTVMDERVGKACAAMEAEADVARMLKLLDTMDPRDATVLRMRFGLGGEEKKTLKEIGEHFGLTRERIRQIESEALAKMNENF